MPRTSSSREPRLITARTLPAEESARIDATEAILGAQATVLEVKQDKAHLTRKAEQAGADANAATARLHKIYPITSSTTARAFFGAIAIIANLLLETSMFDALGVPQPLAFLVATLTTAVFAGFGLLAHGLLQEGSDEARMKAIAVFAALVLGAAFLVPILATARAQEMVGEKIKAAQSSIAVTSMYASGGSSAEQLVADDAQAQLPILQREQDTLQKVFTVVLAAALASEVAFAGYAFDLPTRWRAARKRKRQQRLTDRATECDDDIASAMNDLQTEINDVARRYAIDVDRIGEIADERLTTIRAFGSSAAPVTSMTPALPADRTPNVPSPLHHAPPTMIAATVAGPGAAPGDIQWNDGPTAPAATGTGEHWDGAWA